MSDPVVALLMLGLFLIFILMGFPVAFTLMAMGIGFGYYAYFDADRMWRAMTIVRKGVEDDGLLSGAYFDGFFNNQIFRPVC